MLEFSLRASIGFLLAACFLLPLSAIAEEQVAVVRVDEEPVAGDYADVLAKLCANKHLRISRPSTIQGLARVLHEEESQLRARHDIPDRCIDMYQLAIGQLASLVTGNSEGGLCGDKSVSAISNFHWRYVVCRVDAHWARNILKSDSQLIPTTLVNFFIDFSNELAARCASKLEASLLEAQSSVDSQQLAEADALVTGSDMANKALKTHVAIVQPSEMTDHARFTLIWQSAVNKLRLRGDLPVDTDEDYESSPVAHVKMQDAKEVWGVQNACRGQLRPIYSESTLPVMRLLEMGFGLGSFRSEHPKSMDSQVKHWYLVTQLCEYILGVKFYQDPSLKPGSVVRMDPFEAEQVAAKLSGPPSDEEAVQLARVSVMPLELADQLQTSSLSLDSDKLLAELRSNIKIRSSFYRAIFDKLYRYIQTTPISKMMKVLLPDKRRASSTKEPEPIKESRVELMVEQSHEFLTSDDLGDHEAGKSEQSKELDLSPSRRRKRETAEEISERKKVRKQLMIGTFYLIALIIIILMWI